MFLYRACQLHAGGSAANNRKRVLLTRRKGSVIVTLDQFPALHEGSQGFDADGVAVGAGDGAAVGLRAQIERKDVEMHHWPPCAVQDVIHQVKFLDIGLNQPRAGHLRQRAQINQEVVFPGVPGDESRQGAGVGRVHITGDQRDIKTRHGAFGQAHEHSQMAVPAAEQDQALLRGGGMSVLHASVTCVCSTSVARRDTQRERMSDPVYRALGRMILLSMRDSRKCASQPTLRAMAKPAVK